MAGPDVTFWQRKFEAGDTPWDRGGAGPQLVRWLDDAALAPCRILVPGCGSGHEVAELARRGFEVTGLDYAPAAIERCAARLQALDDAPGAAPGETRRPPVRERATLVVGDALAWKPDTPFDAVYEQTCLCALHPDHWVRYAAQVHRWLRPRGRLYLMMMQVPRPGAAEGRIEGPPYHCDVNAVRALFDASRWTWPAPPYARVPHPSGAAELAVVLERAD